MNFETKTLPSGIFIENRPRLNYKYIWYIKGTYILHNEGEPAYETINAYKSWYQNDLLHRLDGPAVEHGNDRQDYYINNFYYKEKDYWKHPDVLAFKYLQEHPELRAFT